MPNEMWDLVWGFYAKTDALTVVKQACPSFGTYLYMAVAWNWNYAGVKEALTESGSRV